MRGARPAVAVSGVDGAGKSTLIGELTESLTAQGVHSSVVWFRPGMGLEFLAPAARLVKRLLGQDPAPTLRRVATTEGALRTRRGLLGWVWALVVTVLFLVQVRRQQRRARGIVLYDRHLLDALVTLDVFYTGVDLRVHRALVRLLLPPATATFYLDVPVGVATARKPGDTIGEAAVRRQLEAYASRRRQLRTVHTLDGTRPVGDLLPEVLAELRVRGLLPGVTG